MATVVLYSRPGCHLCDEARAAILDVRGHVPFGFDEVNIETDDALIREYGIRIPVVTIDGEEAFEVAVDAAAFRAAVTG